MTDDAGLNEYDDAYVPTTGEHGIDVASQRLDDLDRNAIRYALEIETGGAVDIGCGHGHQGIRLAMLGLDTTLVDILEIGDRIEAIGKLLAIQDRLCFTRTDARDLEPEDLPSPLRLAFSQRFLHYLRYEAAESLVDVLSTRMREHDAEARFYVSASGLHTELGDDYPHRNRDVSNRFCKLSAEMRDKHGISEPVCLYSKSELETLLTDHGFEILESTTSSFGNVKTVARVRK